MLSIGAASVGTMGLAHAATNSDTNTNPQSDLIEKLVAKFNLKQADVQKVFDENRNEREAEHEQRAKEQLDQLVKDGKITQEQSDKIIAKAKELKAARDTDRTSMDGKTDEERKAAMEAKRTEIDNWLSDNGLDKEYGRYLLMGHVRGGPGGPPPSDSRPADN